MAVVKCKNNHYYDDLKFKKCPHCEKKVLSTQNHQPIDEPSPTVAKIDVDSIGATQSLRGQVDDIQKTISIYSAGNNTNPVAGWLVCIKGKSRGKSEEVHIGKNFAGRGMNMDIHLYDESISRENHFSIVFEPKGLKYYLVQETGIVYLNDELLNETAELKDSDKITAGNSEYIFIPFCKEGRTW